MTDPPRQRSNHSDYEPILNGELAECLKKQGLDTKAEKKGSPKRSDVTVVFKDSTIICEAEIGEGFTGAVKDAKDRAKHIEDGQVLADAVVAVVYPTDMTREQLSTTERLRWVNVYPFSEENQRKHYGGVADLATHLKQLSRSLGDPHTQAKLLNDALGQAVTQLTKKDKRRLAEAMDLPTVVEGEDKSAVAAKRSLLVIAAAVMFHARLDIEFNGSSSRPRFDARYPDKRPFTGEWPPKEAGKCARSPLAVDDLIDAWEVILAKDYRPVFELARNALAAPTRSPKWNKAVRFVARAGVNAATSAAAAGHDLLGRIFHRLLDTARYDGSYYTSVSAAALLATLSLPEKERLPPNLADFRVIDPACGTGTLLMAVAERIRTLRGAEHSREDAATLVEEILWGLDTNATACHMAATTIGLLSPSTSFDLMNVARIPLGTLSGKGVVGSLELLEDATTGQKRWMEEWFGEQVETKRALNIEPNSFNMVIMNPPYTRDSLRYDQFTKMEEEALRERTQTITAGRSGHGAALGSLFVDLAEHLVNLHEGTISMVWPRTGVAAPSSKQSRELLAEQFHVEWVIASNDPRRTCFSENTSIAEVLIVCRRHSEPEPAKRPPTKFVRLRVNSRDATDAIGIARDLLTGQNLDNVSEWPAEKMAAGNWDLLTITSAHLARVATCLNDGAWERNEFTILGNMARVGPGGQRIRDVFTKHKEADDLGRRGLWYNDTNRVNRLTTSPDVYIHAKRGERAQRLARKYYTQASHLLLAAKPRFDTLKVVAALSDEPTIGSGWIPVAPVVPEITDEKLWNKAMSVYLNSTLGMLAILAVAAPNVMSRPNLSLDAIRSIPVPRLIIEHPEKFASVFGQIKDTTLLPLQEAQQCSVRKTLDRTVSNALGVNLEILRRELVLEPSVGYITTS